MQAGLSAGCCKKDRDDKREELLLGGFQHHVYRTEMQETEMITSPPPFFIPFLII